MKLSIRELYALVVLGALTVGFLLGGVVGFNGLFSEATAAWLQFLGATVSVGVAVWIAHREGERANKLAAAENGRLAMEQTSRRIGVLREAANSVRSALAAMETSQNVVRDPKSEEVLRRGGFPLFFFTDAISNLDRVSRSEIDDDEISANIGLVKSSLRVVLENIDGLKVPDCGVTPAEVAELSVPHILHATELHKKISIQLGVARVLLNKQKGI